ncbi:MAG: DegT/DnrJ/EryC1/StrS family aminotransferase [Gammaproteobacteria bacterium]|nr:DegT/DnrJ/EryC1/StrS family aminotransferase [Gammaproteobacteria bacterium]
MKQIQVAGPSITNKEIEYVNDAIKNAWFENANIYNERFEKTFAEYISVKHAISLPSCTSAIHLSLLSQGIGPGDEVIVPDITWIASAAPISYVGATPIFSDIDPKTWCIDTNSIESLITKKTKAIIPVGLYGSMPDMPKILEIAHRNKLFVIEDAAESFGSKLRNQQAGSFGHTGVFSFHGSKTMTTGEGGMLVTNDDDIAARVAFLRDHGRSPGDTRFQNTEIAYKYKMSNLQAAIGLAQVERAEELIMKKREIYSWYFELLKNESSISLNSDVIDGRNSFWMSTAVIDSKKKCNKFHLIEKMKLSGISCRPFFDPLSSLEAYKSFESSQAAQKRNAISYSISKQGINLPSGMNLTRDDVKYISEILLNILLKI